MRTKKSKTVPTGIFSLWILAVSIFVSSDAFASAIQAQSPANIFAASCSTCHGAKGQGGVTFVKDGVGDNRIAPRIAGKPARYVKAFVRAGSKGGAMPAFGREEITDAELNALANALQSDGTGANLVPAAPVGTAVVVNILDADPWFMDNGSDNDNSGVGGTDDFRRVDLDAGEYVKVVNTGRTWHTFTNPAVLKDSGFIGYAGNYRTVPGDLDQGEAAGIGYYYADQATGLAAGCEKYFCKLHPYMQVEVCTDGSDPAGSGVPLGLTRAHKNPIGLPSVAGSGEVWVTTQSQEEVGEDTTTVSNRSVSGQDGTYQVINAGTWGVTRIPNTGNNPHNSWAGNDAAGNDVVLSADWHDNTVVLMDAAAKTVLNRRRSGASNAHVMTTPGLAERFYVSHMGGRAIQEIDVNRLRLGFDPNTGGVIRGATGPHGLWMCDDGSHVLTADTFGNSATLYNLSTKTSKSAGSGGKAPLAPAIMGGFGSGCDRGFTNNALTTDVSIYDISGDNVSRNIGWAGVADPGGASIKSGTGNITLRNTATDQVPGGAFQARWAHLPIQTPVSPADATTHGRFMVTANKASFNVSITALSSVTGLPTGLYTIPAGLGAHGVTYGPKSSCDTNNDGVADTAFNQAVGPRCYYSYVTNTFEDYVSVYDLEKIDDGVSMGGPGSALLAETIYVEGGAVQAVIALDANVAGLCDIVPDAAGGALDVLDCGVGPLGVYVSNLPLGVLCPDCRSGVHAGDVPLTLTTGAQLAAGLAVTATDGLAALASGIDGAGAKYTYLKEEVYVDTETVTCALIGLNGAPYPAGYGGLNNCNGVADGDLAGVLNLPVPLDLDLGINTGAQGIMGRNTANGKAPVTPWQ